jgi:hypothetical protein
LLLLDNEFAIVQQQQQQQAASSQQPAAAVAEASSSSFLLLAVQKILVKLFQNYTTSTYTWLGLTYERATGKACMTAR